MRSLFAHALGCTDKTARTKGFGIDRFDGVMMGGVFVQVDRLDVRHGIIRKVTGRQYDRKHAREGVQASTSSQLSSVFHDLTLIWFSADSMKQFAFAIENTLFNQTGFAWRRQSTT